jgi:glycosyltransferase involved in cell wall biosynthesis
MNNLPFISICTPTFNRRPFFPTIIKCFQNQTYPIDKMEWIIIDDGTDPIGDIVKDIPQIKYFYYPTKMYLGKKRNIMHEKCKGSIIIYMDDDDYYPPERVSHAVETLQKNPQALCAGSSEMYIYFKHIHKMMQFGPYGPNHATAATFAFRKELLQQTSYDDTAALAEETMFLKKYTIPFVQLDPLKTILVFSHEHNSFDKKKMLDSPNKFMKFSDKTASDFIKDDDIKHFFMVDIDELLANYEPGKPEHKPEVFIQMEEMTVRRKREGKIRQLFQAISQIDQPYVGEILRLVEEQNKEYTELIHKLKRENSILSDKNSYLDKKISEVITNALNKAKLLK